MLQRKDLDLLISAVKNTASVFNAAAGKFLKKFNSANVEKYEAET